MRYLYGDSTESALEANYLAFLRDALDFAVGVLQRDAAMAAGRERKLSRERAASDAAHAIEDVARQTVQVTDAVVKAAGDAPSGRVASAIAQATADAVRREAGNVRAGLASDLEMLEAEAQRHRAGCVAALSTLLQAHDLPGAERTVTVRWVGGAYEVQLAQKTEYGLVATQELEVESTSIFAHDIRVDKIADGVEVHAPETAGWLKKEVKMVPHKLGKHHLTQLSVADDGIALSLRATPEPTAPGFDIVVARDGTVGIDRVGAEAGAAFDPDDRDLPQLKLLAERLEEAVKPLRERRRKLVSATLDEVALADHQHPRLLVERLVAAMAPVVQEIARHSLTAHELVLKRLLAGDRREEIFVSKAELLAKLEPLPAPLRRVFSLLPLGLEGGGGGGVPAPEPPTPRPARRTNAPPLVPPPVPPLSPAKVAAAEAAVDNALAALEDETTTAK